MGDSLITALTLAVVALLESVRRLSPGTLVLRRNAFGPWKIARTFEIGTGMHVLALCIPYTLPVVLRPVGPEDRGRLSLRRLIRRVEARARRARIDLVLLRVIGLVVLTTVVLGIPFAISRWSGWGLIVSVQLLLVLTMAQATIATIALTRVGVGWRTAVASSLKFLWPFSAPHAAGLVQERVVAGVPPLVVAHMLLGEQEFLRSLRALVYDTQRKGATTDDGRVLLQLCDPTRLNAFLRGSPPSSADLGDPFCPRCAMVYRAGVRECSDCQGVALETAAPV